MSVSSLSFWQQDQNWRIQQQSWSQQLTGSNAISAAMTSALSNKSAGMASIANQQALTRVTNQIKAALSGALNSGSGSSAPGASFSSIGASTGVPFNYATALSSSVTASSFLSGAIANSSSAGSALANLISGSSVNILA